MTTSHLLKLLRDAKLSPEELGDRMGISGMTIRRLQHGAHARPLPKLYATALLEVVRELLAEGRLPLDSESALAIKENLWLPFLNAAGSLGVRPEMLQGDTSNTHHLMESLSQIGQQALHRESVTNGKAHIFSFKRLGAEWKRRITALWSVLTSKELLNLDKLVAYGALFYLVTPFDLIPDGLPVIGYMDDYVVLGLATAYYIKRFPRLFH